MRLLFVKLKHIGDALLLTPTLASVRHAYPGAHITVIVRRGSDGILGGCTAIDRIVATAAPESSRRSRLNWLEDFQQIRALRRERFDFVFELSDGDRGRWFARGVRAERRCTNAAHRPLNWWWRRTFDSVSHFPWESRHRVEKDYFTVRHALPIPDSIPPLVFDPERCVPWAPAGSFQDYAVIHPATRWKRKQWPTENWIALGRFILTKVKHLVVSVGPDADEIRLGNELVSALGPSSICTLGGASWNQLAWLLRGARLFAGVDTAAMHLAAACQCPIVALFGPSVVEQWRPWKVLHALVQPERLAGESTRTADIHVETVTSACCQMLMTKPEDPVVR